MRLTVLTVPADDADRAAARLWAAGAGAVEERVLGGLTSLVTALGSDDVVAMGRIGEVPPGWVVEFIDDDSVPSEAWRDHARPVEVNRELVLQPAWLPSVDDPGRTLVVVEPGGAFGLGDHPTTRLAADAAWRLTREGDRVLDVGSGTGVLSIVALLRGAAAAVAIDIADAAREATFDNAQRNGVSDRLTVSCTPLAGVDGTFDVVFANILAPTLISLAEGLVGAVRPGGHLVVSGILAERHDHVVEALAGLTVVATRTIGAWACVEFVKSVE